MKAGRRLDPDSFRRDPRDRPFPFGRFRKRPSMLSDLHGKHYNHKPDRDSADGPYFRPYNRYGYDPPMGLKHDRYGPGLHKVEMGDPRRHPYAPHYPRYHPHWDQPNTHYNDVVTDYSADEEAPINKRPRLYVDISRRASMQFDTPNSADSSVSSNFESTTPVTAQPMDSPAHSPPMQGTGLSAYLEDIDSDDDTLLRDEEEEKEPVKTPPEPSSSVLPKRPTKEELLQMMERVDRDIAATESQIAALQKKQAELKENAKASTSSSSVPPTPSSFQPSPPASSSSPCPTFPEESYPVPSPSEERRPSPKRSLADTIYAENRLKARGAQLSLASLNFPPAPAHSVRPLYHQPSEAPKYHRILEEHKIFRPKLIEFVRKRKLEKHQQELKLCKKYDALMTDWEKKVSKAEGSTKRKTRDAKNRELFERVFPELKARREQQERFTNRVDQRGYGMVRSDAELNELMYELYEKEEASVRYRRTHAVIPAMITDKREKSVSFHSSNGLIADPMTVYRESKFANVWTDGEKRTFKDKYVLYPKNFEAVASYLPNKSTADCVKHYYLCKKNEHFKQLVRKANLKRRKTFAKTHDLPLTSPALVMGGPSLPVPPPSFLMVEKPKMEPLPIMERADPLLVGQKTAMSLQAPVLQRYGDWTEEEIDRLKEGLKKYGRAWGKIYREVGGRKTATQCKQFYDDFCNDESLDLQQALTEHGIMKNAEKARRKAESRKPVLNIIAEAKKKEQKQKAVSVATEDGDSENTESASESESGESGSESTITDSSPEEAGSHMPKRAQGSRKTGRMVSGSSGLPSRRTSSEAALDLFISAAEVLNNIVPPDIALHDHTYALPPSSLINSVDFQGSSGLSLIAAAAAVVSPSLSRSAGSGKLPVLSPVRAPRGRPPNSQKRGSSSSISKLAPTLLSPAGSSSYVPLTDVKTTTFRGRTRSAPSDRPRSAVQIPRAPSTLSRISISSGSRAKGVMPPASYSRHRDSSSNSPSLKSMIASHPQQANSSTAAFEALVNVAVAAPPAELPRTSTSSHPAIVTPAVMHSTGHRNTSKSSSTPVTPVCLPPHQHQVKEGGTTTAMIDVHQAINILALASLAGQTSSMSQSVPVQSVQSLFAQAPILQPALLGSIVAQNNGDSSNSASVSDSAVNAVAYTSVGALLGQLTHSGVVPVVKPTVTPVVTTASSGSNSSSGSKAKSVSASVSKSEPTSSQPTSTTVTHSRPWENSHSPVTTTSADKPRSWPPPKTTTASDDLSNLNLLSTLVAAVAASQPSPPDPKPTTVPITVGGSSEMTPTSTEGDQRPIPEAPTMVTPFTAAPVMPQAHITSTSVSSESLTSAVPKGTESAPHTEHKSRLGRQASPRPGTTVEGNTSKIKGAVSLSLQLHTNCDELPTSVTRTIASALAKETKDASQQEHPTDNLPRSAVRTNPQALHSIHSTGSNDMTASLASIIPSSLSYPQQSTLLLYTRSLSFPLSATAEPPPEEEDHLESATRGISELSKLLGTDSSTASLRGSNKNSNSSYKGLTSWNQSDLLNNPPDLSFSGSTSSTKTVHSSTAANPLFPKADFGSEISKPFLSSLLESHGTVHNTSAPNLGNTNSNNSNIRTESNGIDCKHSR